VEEEFAPPPVERPAEEFNIGPDVNVHMPMTQDMLPMQHAPIPVKKPAPVFEALPDDDFSDEELDETEFDAEVPSLESALPVLPATT
ncbi:hypothetical protein, partial [Streptomyces scabiei]|uniref:hypothetical protein n=1 Tax=Streptomyces scabiei TaxID=1930 RepID=UPI0038F80A38